MTYIVTQTDTNSGITTAVETTVAQDDLTTSPVEIQQNGPTTNGSLDTSVPANSVPIEEQILSNTCFPASTPIETDQGIIYISKINPKIHTIRGKKIEAITQTISMDKYLVCFEKDSLFKNVPNKKTIMTKTHSILYKGSLVCSNEFIKKFDGIHKVRYSGEILYNVLFAEHDKIVVNNMICESLRPDNFVAQFYNKTRHFSPELLQQAIIKVNKVIKEKKLFNNKNNSNKTQTK
jgi:hypothetical protein